MAGKALALGEELYDYLLAATPREHDLLRQLREETATLPEAMMQITPEQGQFMGWLTRLSKARQVLEIGVFTGYSSLAVLLAMPADGHMLACDLSESWTAVARRYWALAGVASRVDLRLGPALATLNQLLAEGRENSFDMAFIDADKTHYDDYYERALVLVRPGGIVVIDNLLWSGRVADPAAMDADTLAIRALNDKLRHDNRIAYSLLPVADGLGLALKL